MKTNGLYNSDIKTGQIYKKHKLGEIMLDYIEIESRNEINNDCAFLYFSKHIKYPCKCLQIPFPAKNLIIAV